MKKIKVTLTIVVAMIGMLVFSHEVVAQDTKTYVRIDVDGLSCPFCAYGMEKNLKKVKGAKKVYISVTGGYTTFEVPTDKKPTEETLTKIVEDAGFTARKISYSPTPFAKDDE